MHRPTYLLAIGFLLLALLAAGCTRPTPLPDSEGGLGIVPASTAQPTQEPSEAPTATDAPPSATTRPSATPRPTTATPAPPTDTPRPTRTPAPTDTPAPTATNTRPPATNTAPPPLPTNTFPPPPPPADTQPPPPPAENCDRASYPDVCIPHYPPDINCGDIPHRRFRVLPPDPHGFDRDNDGIGCES